MKACAVFFFSSMLLIACGNGDSTTTLVNVPTTKSEKQRVTSPSVSADELAAQVRANNTFSLELFQKVRSAGNTFVSPHSISTALAMLYGGARNETEKQMSQVLHFPQPQGTMHQVFNKLDLELGSRGKNAVGTNGQPFQLSVANALWGRPDGTYLPDYLDLLALNYGASINLVDFGGDTEGARNQINSWVASRTADRIKELLQKGDIDANTALVLTNTIYFNAAWSEPFNMKLTTQADFDADGNKVRVDMMAGDKKGASYGQGQGYQLLELPYDGKELSMLVLLPEAGTFQSFAASLKWPTVETALATLAPTDVFLRMPRFEFKSRRQLKDALIALGMVDAFDHYVSDFGGICGAVPGTNSALFITKVIHEAFVKVAEKGTEATGATAVVGADAGVSGPITPPLEITLDRPFMIFIRDKATGAVLFTGQVVDPTAAD